MGAGETVSAFSTRMTFSTHLPTPSRHSSRSTPGVGQDTAVIAMKEVNSVTGNFDWSLSYRSFAGEGMIELNMCKNSSTTYAWIRTSTLPLTPGTWHHLAFTFDGNALQ